MNTVNQTTLNEPTPLHTHVEHAVHRYFEALDGEEINNMYDIFLAEMERPLLIATLKHTRGNQSKTAQLLGLNRGTLRTKLKTYGLL
ncbi:DNA-binding transcriptional regulator Fis [Moraxella nasicaprae]|uniref:Putative Fis-like DNA-binding protein n=1 Tax=Moraxella nasicaprae TaxID=2904122 RepID=A0ABY6F332_9GAMM|nr:DNA-binding transcriptional regulator Fis [Moraxella nasicaprae]UXZ04496.1 DNA-binding transcriptional regulator Fis [Moraxella nasicaprae]